MAKIKNVVKVMNFQSLLRMDKALKEADKYRDVGKEITNILGRIMYNKNLILDKKIMAPDQDMPELNIYIANDYGFCGNFNSEVSKRVKKDIDSYKIVIGKKIVYNDDKILLKIMPNKYWAVVIITILYSLSFTVLENLMIIESFVFYTKHNSMVFAIFSLIATCSLALFVFFIYTNKKINTVSI
jgi:hypothetical protein